MPNAVLSPPASAVEREIMSSAAAPGAEPMSSAGSWLCRAEFDRERMLDMEQRVRPVRRKTFMILAVAIAAVGPWLGWLPLVFLVPASLVWSVAERFMPRMRRPEFLMFGAWVGAEVTIAVAVWLEGGHLTAALSWLAIPVITLGSRFSMRGVVAGVTIAVILVLAVGIGANPHAFAQDPEFVFAPLALVLSVAVLSTPLMRSDIEHRSDAVVDQLTGMLNRKALSARALELSQQSDITGEPVGMIVADLDNFKDVNDTHGHTVGDLVLREVAYTLRKELRAFDLAYRLGGEEFLILVPGSDAEQTYELAERLRRSIAETRMPEDVELTISCGVGASAPSERFSYATVFARADAALYRAKRAGRDRVCAENEPQFAAGALVRGSGALA
jgi:diguanylate cyclase (GGDEF)-like protein